VYTECAITKLSVGWPLLSQAVETFGVHVDEILWTIVPWIGINFTHGGRRTEAYYTTIASINSQSLSNQPSARVSQIWRPFYLRHKVAKSADKFWHLYRSDCRNTLIYAHTTSRRLPTYDIGLWPLTLLAPEAGDFVKFIQLHVGARSEWPSTETITWLMRAFDNRKQNHKTEGYLSHGYH
jgi:hypothetical protein